MAAFYVNSEGTKAIRLSEIICMCIREENGSGMFSLVCQTANSPYETVLETAETVEDLQALAVQLLAALEE